MIPSLATIPIWVLQLSLIGKEMFTAETPALESNPTLALMLLATGIIELVLVIWSIVVLLKCVGEVQQFSAWRALGSVLLIGLVLLPIILIVVFFSFVRR